MSAHLVHGMGTELEAPTWPAITAAEAEVVLGAFADVGTLERLTWHSPRPFSAAALLRTSAGELLLKRHHERLRSPAALAEEHGFMAHLRGAGVSIPEVLPARDGATAIRQGAWTYELHRLAEGLDLYRDRASWTPFLSHAHALAAGKALARLHVAARDYQGEERAPHPLVASFTILPAPDPLAAAQAYVAARPALASFLADKPWQQQLATLFAALGEGLAGHLDEHAPLWTHNDWHPSNLLWSPDGDVRTVIDFGLAARTCAVHDLATAIERTTVSWLELTTGAPVPRADIDAAVQLLDGYCEILPLTREDRETIIRLLPLVHLEFAMSEVDYFAGIVGDPVQADLAWSGYAIGHAEWFLSPAGQAFLQQLRHEALL